MEAQDLWIPVTERLPEMDEKVMIFSSNGRSDFARVTKDEDGNILVWRNLDWWEDVPVSEMYVTHWMPPIPPPRSYSGA